MPEQWKSDIEDWSLVTDEKASFLLDESKIVLQSYLDGSDKLENKAFIITGILFTIISGLLGFLISKYQFDKTINDQNWSLLAYLIILIGCYLSSFYFFKKSINLARFKPIGNTPKNLATKAFFSSDIDLMKFKEAESYQTRIDQCLDVMSKKGRNIEIGLTIAFYAPTSWTILFGLIKLIFYLF